MTTNTDWIEWAGGECPVGFLSRLDVKFRDGDIHIGKMCGGSYHWGHCGQGGEPDGFWPGADIIAYRIVKP